MMQNENFKISRAYMLMDAQILLHKGYSNIDDKRYSVFLFEAHLSLRN